MRSLGPAELPYMAVALGVGLVVEDISRQSLCRGAACGFVWHQQGPSYGWQGCGGQETPHQRSLCHVAAVGEGLWRAVARPLLPTLNGCHGLWLHSDYGMMDYDDGDPFSACRVKGNKQSMTGWWTRWDIGQLGHKKPRADIVIQWQLYVKITGSCVGTFLYIQHLTPRILYNSICWIRVHEWNYSICYILPVLYSSQHLWHPKLKR